MSAKRQHFNPVVHLKHFVGSQPKGQVWTYDAVSGDVWPATPANTAVQAHLYSIERDDGTMDTSIEEHFAKLEGQAAPVYEALLGGAVPRNLDRAAFAVFLALMYVRTPLMLRNSAEMYGRHLQIMNYAYGSHDEAFEGLTRRVEKDLGRKIDSDTKKKVRAGLLDPSGYVIKVPREEAFEIFAAGDKLAPLLAHMTWTLVKAVDGFFVTSDNPLVRIVNPRTRHPIYGDHGFLNETAEVTFPLSPRLLLLMTWEKKAPEHAVIGAAVADQFNRVRAANSDRYLYAHRRDERVQQLAAEFKGSRPTWTTEGFGPDKFAEIRVPRRARS